MSSRFATMITRGKVALAMLFGRTVVQATGFDGETFGRIELLMPPFYTAMPLAGADIIFLQTNGVRGHLVALGGDNLADKVADLQPGEGGLAHNGKQVLLRLSQIAIVDPQKIVLQAPELYWSPDGVTMHKLATDAHTHGGVSTGVGDTEVPGTTAGMVTG